jgi:lysophospholipase L1-like esterase
MSFLGSSRFAPLHHVFAAASRIVFPGDSQSDEHTSLNGHPQGLWTASVASRLGATRFGRGTGVVGVKLHATLSGGTIASTVVVDAAGTISGAGATNGTNTGPIGSIGDLTGPGTGAAISSIVVAGNVISSVTASPAGSGYLSPLVRFQDNTDATRAAIGGDLLVDAAHQTIGTAVSGLYANRAARINAYNPGGTTPWAVVIWTGTNDSGNGTISAATFKTFYTALVAYLQGVTNPPFIALVGLTTQTGYINNPAFTQAIAEVAMENGLPFIPLGHLGPSVLVDGVHPTIAGQQQIADVVSSVLGG